MTTFGAGLVALIVIVVFTYLGFTKFANPFSSPYTVHVIFANANQLSPASLVRIAGVNVGKVKQVSAVGNCKTTSQTPGQCNVADVTIEIENQGLPLHKDATFWIRPRIFLEGNFFVDVSPGSPESPVAPSGFVFPLQQAREPVQFDQVLTSLQADTRRNLQILLQQYGIAVKEGGPGYNRSIQYWLPAYQYSAIVAHDSLGLQPHDLSNWLYKSGDVAAALDAHPPALKSFITDFNITAEAFARESANLQKAVAELPRTLAAAGPALTALNNALCAPPFTDIHGGAGCAPGPVRNFAKAFIPGVRTTAPMIDASLPFITQLRLLVRPQELGGLVADLSQTVPALTQLTQQTIPFLRNQVRPLSSCIVNVTYPWSQSTVNDPHFNASNGFPPRKVYVEAADFLPGLAGESRNFDANTPYIRVLLALGNTLLTSLGAIPGQPGALIGGLTAPLVGAQPQPPPGYQHPPFMPNVPCETQPAVTDFSTPTSAAPAQYGNLSVPLPTNVLNLLGLNLHLPPISADNSNGAAGSGGSGAAGGSAPRASTPSYTPLTPAQAAAARQYLAKYGVFNIVPPSLTPNFPGPSPSPSTSPSSGNTQSAAPTRKKP